MGIGPPRKLDSKIASSSISPDCHRGVTRKDGAHNAAEANDRTRTSSGHVHRRDPQ